MFLFLREQFRTKYQYFSPLSESELFEKLSKRVLVNSPSFFDPYLDQVPYRCKQLQNPVCLISMDRKIRYRYKKNWIDIDMIRPGVLKSLILTFQAYQSSTLINVEIKHFTPRRFDKTVEIFRFVLLLFLNVFLYFIIGRVVFYSSSYFYLFIVPLYISLMCFTHFYKSKKKTIHFLYETFGDLTEIKPDKK